MWTGRGRRSGREEEVGAARGSGEGRGGAGRGALADRGRGRGLRPPTMPLVELQTMTCKTSCACCQQSKARQRCSLHARLMHRSYAWLFAGAACRHTWDLQ